MKFVEKKNTIAWVFLAICLVSPFSSAFGKIPDRPHGDLPSDYWQFWFLYESEKRPGQDYYRYRPFYSRFSEHETAYKQQTILFPVYYREETHYWYTWSVLFLFTGTGFKHEDTGEDNDLLTPVLIWGRGDTDKDKYFGVFPFYGNIKGKLGYDEINFFLFPIYADWKRKDYKAKGVLWPLVMWASTEKRDDIRVFPFYSKKEHQGKYYRYSILWPFFQWGRTYMDKREPISYGLYFPFYGYKKSDFGNMKSFGLIWVPFLGSFAGYGYDNKTSELNLNMIFFLIQYGKNNSYDYRKFILFPFYGTYHFASKESTFVTPFYFRMKTDTHHLKAYYTYLLPFFTHIEKYYPEWERTDYYWKFWPLAKFHRDPEGSVEWNAFTLFPLRSQELEDNWDPIISVIDYKNLSNGEKRLSLLFRLYSQRWTEDEFSVYIPFLTDLENRKESFEWQFFYGLLGYKKESEKSSFRLFWLIEI